MRRYGFGPPRKKDPNDENAPASSLSGGSPVPTPEASKPAPAPRPVASPGKPDRQHPFRYDRRAIDQEIEAELAAAMAEFNVDSLGSVAQPSAPPPPPSASGRKRGTVVGVHGQDVFVDVPGGRSQGVLPLIQFDQRPQVGDVVEFEVERYDSANGLLILTRTGAAQVVTDWSSVAVGMIVEARVTGTNKNKTGLLIEINNIKGFMPASQIDLYRVEDLDQFVNQRLKCLITEVNPAERNLLASRRALLEREKQAQAEQFWQTIAEGQTLSGVVRNIKPFGVFVDLGGQDGLIPVSELSWARVNDPSELLEIGQSVEVLVTRVDRDARRIGLSLKRLSESPFDEYVKKVQPGNRVTGQVSRLAEFGAFVELAPGVEGLIHLSELSTQRVRKPREVVTEGQIVEVEVLSIDSANRRIGLSLKAITSEKEALAQAEAEAAEEAERLAAEQRLAQRKANPNLRGGLGNNRPLLGEE